MAIAYRDGRHRFSVALLLALLVWSSGQQPGARDKASQLIGLEPVAPGEAVPLRAETIRLLADLLDLRAAESFKKSPFAAADVAAKAPTGTRRIPPPPVRLAALTLQQRDFDATGPPT